MDTTRFVAIAAAGSMLVFILWGCATENDSDRSDDRQFNDTRQQIEDEFGPLNESQIAGFEREILSQYGQLQIHYEEFDQVRNASSDEVAGDHEEHRLHRKLKRRHRTLARLHEDRMWLHVSREGPSANDRQLAEAHRAAANWHETRFRADGMGIDDQDAELEALREQIDAARPDAVEPQS